MSQHDLERLMHDYYQDHDDERAPDRLSERIESIPDTEPDPSITPQGWRQRLGRWLGRDAGDMRSADVRGRSRPTDDGRSRLMITAGTATVVAALTLGVAFLGGDALEDGRDQRALDAAFTAESPPGPDDFMRAAPVTVTSCGAQTVRDGDYFEDEGDDALPLYHFIGLVETSTWESSGSLYGEDEPRLAGTATRVLNESSGSRDGVRFADLGLSAFRVANGDGAWEGTSTMFTRSREPGRSLELLVLEGRGGYDGLTAVLQFPPIDEESGWYPDCFELFGIIAESGTLPMPEPIDADMAGLEPSAGRAIIGTAYQDDAFLPPEETGFALAPGSWTIEIMNMSEVERGFVIEDSSGRLVAGSTDDLIAPGDMRVYELDVEGSGAGHVMYDPVDREGTEMAIPAAE